MKINDTVEKDVVAGRRYLVQAAKQAVVDIYDAVTELATNSDDRYQILEQVGTIEIDVERRRGSSSLVHVRDFADGMTSEVMDLKLSNIGGRVSGMSEGEAVRGTNSRGAKDVSSIGMVTFRSIAEDGRFHKCSISSFMVFKPYPSRPVTKSLRQELGIPRGTGTLVTIELNSNVSVPQHSNLREKLERLVSLRDILSDPRRKVTLRDVNSGQRDRLHAPTIQGVGRVKVQLDIPGYPEASAKLTIRRAHKRFERGPARFRTGGILVKSRHGIHEATLFDVGLESDPNARWFYGRLVCEYIDTLYDDFDELLEQRRDATAENPVPVLDPTRQSGLTRGHPFVRALTAEVLKRLRPLVEEERKRAEKVQASIENRATRERLDKLEAAAAKFMDKYGDDEARDTSSHSSSSQLFRSGYQLSPPFSQIVVHHSIPMALTVNQKTFPEVEAGATVQIECHDEAITTSKRFATLEPHQQHEGILKATWKVTAEAASAATGVRVRVGPISTEARIEVFGSEADRYRNVNALEFQRKRYIVRTGAKRRKIRLVAPLSISPAPTAVDVSIEGAGRHLRIIGETILKPHADLGVAICEFSVKSTDQVASGVLSAKVGDSMATARVESVLPPGIGIKIDLKPIDFVNQRYRWRTNVLEIAAYHPSLSRYLGDEAAGFPGQDEPHFRLLLAEIVSDAVCAQMLSGRIDDHPEDYVDADWDDYYAEYSKLMTEFLPVAHSVLYPI